MHGVEPAPEWQVEHVLPTDRDNDGLRDLEAAERGIQVLRITAGMLREQPGRARAMIVRILRRRLAEQEALRRTER